MINVPQNSYMALMVFFSSEEKPISRAEMDEFWNSCSIKEKHEFMTADLGRHPENLHGVARSMPQYEFTKWYYGQNPQPWCEELPAHYHTKDGPVPKNPYEELMSAHIPSLRAIYKRSLDGDAQDEKRRKFLGMRSEFEIVDEWNPSATHLAEQKFRKPEYDRDDESDNQFRGDTETD